MKRARARPSPRLTEALARFGAGLRNLRLRRRMPTAYAADLALISRSTALGIYAAVLENYGMLERLESLTATRWDRVGLGLDEERLPQRVRNHPTGRP